MKMCKMFWRYFIYFVNFGKGSVTLVGRGLDVNH